MCVFTKKMSKMKLEFILKVEVEVGVFSYQVEVEVELKFGRGPRLPKIHWDPHTWWSDSILGVQQPYQRVLAHFFGLEYIWHCPEGYLCSSWRLLAKMAPGRVKIP